MSEINNKNYYASILKVVKMNFQVIIQFAQANRDRDLINKSNQSDNRAQTFNHYTKFPLHVGDKGK